MTDEEIFELFKLQSENVRSLRRTLNILNKDLNHQLRKSDLFQLSVKTKIYTLIYSAWSEAQFTQILYTPRGFLWSEIEKIKLTKKSNGIASGWFYMLEMAMQKVGSTESSQDLKQRLNKLIEIVKSYIEEPSIVRNKIAHGQWVYALNSDNTALNVDITQQLNDLDYIEIAKKIRIHEFLGYIVRDLIQSPKNGFHNYYWTNIVNLEKYVIESSGWSISSKKELLKRKQIRHENKA